MKIISAGLMSILLTASFIGSSRAEAEHADSSLEHRVLVGEISNVSKGSFGDGIDYYRIGGVTVITNYGWGGFVPVDRSGSAHAEDQGHSRLPTHKEGERVILSCTGFRESDRATCYLDDIGGIPAISNYENKYCMGRRLGVEVKNHPCYLYSRLSQMLCIQEISKRTINFTPGRECILGSGAIH